MADPSRSRQSAEKTRALVAQLWERNKPLMLARLEMLDRAATAVPLSEGLRIEARDTAHKLAGSLGMFGFSQGTEIARQLELALDSPEPDQPQLASLATLLRQELFPASESATH